MLLNYEQLLPQAGLVTISVASSHLLLFLSRITI